MNADVISMGDTAYRALRGNSGDNSRQVSILTGKDIYSGDFKTRVENAEAGIAPTLLNGDVVNWRYFRRLQEEDAGAEDDFRYRVAVGMLMYINVLTLETQGFAVSYEGGMANPRVQMFWSMPTYFVKEKDAEDYANLLKKESEGKYCQPDIEVHYFSGIKGTKRP